MDNMDNNLNNQGQPPVQPNQFDQNVGGVENVQNVQQPVNAEPVQNANRVENVQGVQQPVGVEPVQMGNGVVNEPEKKKKSRKKLFLLLFLLVMTAILLTTSTYAWFTSNRTVTVEDINVNVSTGSGIQISVDGNNWKTIVTTADIAGAYATYSAATNQLPATLRPVSTTADALSSGYLSMWLGTVETSNSATNRGEYILTTEDVSTVVDNHVQNPSPNQGTAGAFVMFDLFLRLDDNQNTTAQTIYLANGSNVVIQTGSTDLGTQYSSRVAFIKENEIAYGSSVSQIQSLVTSDASNIYVWEPNYNRHNASGLANANSYYNTANQGQQYTPASAGTQVTYHGVKGRIQTSDDLLLSKTNPTDGGSSNFAAVTADIATTDNWSSGNAYEALFTMMPNYVAKVRVYFWIEGQDIDCENNASGGQIALKLQFTLNSQRETS